MTKVLWADATYSETWAEPTQCQASGTVQVSGGTLTLVPSTTSCAWTVVAYQVSVDESALTLISSGLAQQ